MRLRALQMTDEDLTSRGCVDWCAPPAFHQRHARSVDDVGLAPEAVILLQDAQREFLELRRFIGDDDAVRAHLMRGAFACTQRQADSFKQRQTEALEGKQRQTEALRDDDAV